MVDCFGDGDLAEDKGHRPKLAQFRRRNRLPGTTGCIQRETEEGRYTDRKRIVAGRCFSRRSEFAVASVPSSYFASKAKRESDSRDTVRASQTLGPLGADRRCNRGSAYRSGILTHSQMRIVYRPFLRHQQERLASMVQHEHLWQ